MSEETEPLTIWRIKEIVGECLAGSHANSLEFRAGVILLSSLQVGTSVDKLAAFTGYSTKRPFLKRTVERLFETGIFFKDGNGKTGLRVDWLENVDDMGVEVGFTMDCMVVSGEFTREEKDGQLFYKMTDQAIAKVEAMPNV